MASSNSGIAKRLAVVAGQFEKKESEDPRPGGVIMPEPEGVFRWRSSLLFSGSQDFMGSLNYTIFYVPFDSGNSDPLRQVLQTVDGRLRIDLDSKQLKCIFDQVSKTGETPYLVVLVVSGYGAPVNPENEWAIGNYYHISASLFPGADDVTYAILSKQFRFTLTLSYGLPPYDYRGEIPIEIQDKFLREAQPPGHLGMCASTAPMVIFAGHIDAAALQIARKQLSQEHKSILALLGWKEATTAFESTPLDPQPELQRFAGFPGLRLEHARPFATYGLMYHAGEEHQDGGAEVLLPQPNVGDFASPGLGQQQNSQRPSVLPGTPHW